MSTKSRVSLQDYVKENKSKNESTSSLISTGVTDFKAKFVNGFPFTRGAADSEAGTPFDEPSSSTAGSDKASTGSTSSRWAFVSGESAFGLNRTQRAVGFCFCLLAAVLCFGLATCYIPVLLLYSRKFAALNTLGSCFLLFSFALLWGPRAYLSHLCSAQRLPVTSAYLASVAATLFTALWLNSTVLTLVFAALQFCALIWFVLSYVPGGETGLRMLTSLGTRFVRSSASRSASTANLPV